MPEDTIKWGESAPDAGPEANRGLRRHALLTKPLRKALPPLRTTDGQGDAAVAQVKFFSPFGRFTFYVTEFDGDDTFFGYTVSALGPDCDEWGYGSYRELQEATVFGRVPAIERDCYFDPAPVAQLLAERNA